MRLLVFYPGPDGHLQSAKRTNTASCFKCAYAYLSQFYNTVVHTNTQTVFSCEHTDRVIDILNVLYTPSAAIQDGGDGGGNCDGVASGCSGGWRWVVRTLQYTRTTLSFVVR